MGRFSKIFMAFILGLGFSSFAQASDLNETMDSFQVSSSEQPSIYGMEFAKAIHKHHADEEDAVDQTVSLFDNSKMFVQVYTGYDFSFLEDIVTGTNGWVSVAKSEDDATTGGGNNSGILASALWGFRLDKTNSLALDLGSVFTLGNNFTASTPSGAIAGSISPILLSASLDYILDVAKSKGSRTYITAGAGWYHTEVTESIIGPGTDAGGTFTGDTIGGTLGVGEELDLGGSFGLDFSIKGRYANFSKVSSTNGTGLDGSGDTSLAILAASGYNVIAPATNAGIDSGILEGTLPARYATVDYSGIDAKVALNLYF